MILSRRVTVAACVVTVCLRTCVVGVQEPSVLLLVEHKAKQINMQEDSWLPQLLQIMDRFYK